MNDPLAEPSALKTQFDADELSASAITFPADLANDDCLPRFDVHI